MAYVTGVTYTAEHEAYWSKESLAIDTIKTVQLAETLGCNRVSVTHTRTTPANTRDDVMVWSASIAKIVGGGQYGVLGAAEMASAETALDTLNQSLASHKSTDITVNEYIWHEHRANHPATEKGYETTGPAVRRTAKSIVGTATGARLPDQCSCSVTFRTAGRTHWGRVYLPGFAATQTGTGYGRLVTATVDALATYFDTFQSSLNTSGLQLGVWTWAKGAFLPVRQVRVDDVVDIQRRRRAKQVAHYKQFPA